MSVEKVIHGKHDQARHAGKASEVRRIQEADFALQDYQQELFDDFMNEYRESEQMVAITKDPDLLTFHQGRMDYLRPLLEKAGVIFNINKTATDLP